MTECNRKNRLLGKSIRKIRMRRNMTQRELANAIDGISEPALRSYELGERCPKQNTLDFVKSSKKLILSLQMLGTRGGGTSGSWFPGKPETPQKRHGKGRGGTPFSMSFLLSH